MDGTYSTLLILDLGLVHRCFFGDVLSYLGTYVFVCLSTVYVPPSIGKKKTTYKFKVSPGTLVFVFEGLYQFLRYFYSTFRCHFLGPVPALPFPIPRTWVSSGFFEYVSQWRGDDPAACTIAFHTTGGMICPVGLDIIAPEPIEISYILHYIILKVFFSLRLVSLSYNIINIIATKLPPHPP